MQLLECVATVASTSSSATNTAYGSESECWQESAAGDACTSECQTALEEYHAEHPTQPACDDGSVVGSNVLFPSGAGFTFQSEVNNAQCNPEVIVSLMQLDLGSDVNPTFTWAGQITGTYGDIGFEADYASSCDLDDLDWTCVQDPVTAAVTDIVIGPFDFNGSFSSDGEASTATLFYDIVDAGGTCNQSQSMGGLQ